jgi:hypothetical protein
MRKWQNVILTVVMTQGILLGMETRVTYRTSVETVKCLQELSDKYGVSQSALLTMLVNQRWLSENSVIKKTVQDMPAEPPSPFPRDEKVFSKKPRKRH